MYLSVTTHQQKRTKCGSQLNSCEERGVAHLMFGGWADMRVFYCSGYALRCFIKVSALRFAFESLPLRKDQKSKKMSQDIFLFFMPTAQARLLMEV